MKKVFASWVVTLMSLSLALVSCGSARPTAATISLNPDIKHQTFRGWEVAILGTVLDYRDSLPAFDDLFRQAAQDLGITRLQVGIASGTEHPPGYGELYLKGAIPERALVREYAYDIINDNNDPNIADLKKFEFTLLNWQMEHLVVPYKRHLEAAGHKLEMNLTYVDFGRSSFEHHDHPDEYAEFMLVMFEHLKTTYDIVPDAINVMNEPDNTNWTPTMMGRVIVRTAARLAAAGFHPAFIAPSTVNRGRAVAWYEEIGQVRGAASLIKELSFHCYFDDSPDRSHQDIGRKAIQARVATAQNECWHDSNNYQALHRDVKIARTSAWQQGTFIGPEGYYAIDLPSRQATLRPQTKIMRQYYKYIRPGAVRIDATSSDSAMDPLAFVNTDGRYVAVIKAEQAGTFTVNRLPPGTYGISYATETQFDVHLPDITITSGQSVTATIPAPGVATVHAK